VQASGANVRELLEDLGERLPALGAKVYAEGEIQPFVNVYVDGEDVRTRDGLDTPVREGATVILLPAMAGGSLPSPTGGRSRAAEPPSATAWPH
jgi:molybdopterin converting factor small subunit